MRTNAEPDLNILMPQMRHFENDTWTVLPFTTAAYGISHGRLGQLRPGARSTRWPSPMISPISTACPGASSIRSATLLGRDLFVSLDAPDHVSLFAYDNRTFIVQNFRPQPVAVRVLVVHATNLRDLLSGETLAAAPAGADNADSGRLRFGGGRGNFGGAGGVPFEMVLPGHSFRVFQAE